MTPIEETITTRLTPAFTAASICLFWPSQSTSIGAPLSFPPFQVNVGLGAAAPFLLKILASAILTSDRFWILGTADVATMTASAPANAAASASSASSEVTSTAAVAAPFAAKPLRAPSALATATASKASGLDKRYSTASLPVRPPAPVTTILVLFDPVAAAMTATLAVLRQRSARLSRILWRCSSVTKAETGAEEARRQRGVVEATEREEVEERDPLALERREAARARILVLGAAREADAAAAGARARRAGCCCCCCCCCCC